MLGGHKYEGKHTPPTHTQCEIQKRVSELLVTRPSSTPAANKYLSLYIGWPTIKADNRNDLSRRKATSNRQDHGGHTTKNTTRGVECFQIKNPFTFSL